MSLARSTPPPYTLPLCPPEVSPGRGCEHAPAPRAGRCRPRLRGRAGTRAPSSRRRSANGKCQWCEVCATPGPEPRTGGSGGAGLGRASGWRETLLTSSLSSNPSPGSDPLTASEYCAAGAGVVVSGQYGVVHGAIRDRAGHRRPRTLSSSTSHESAASSCGQLCAAPTDCSGPLLMVILYPSDLKMTGTSSSNLPPNLKLGSIAVSRKERMCTKSFVVGELSTRGAMGRS